MPATPDERLDELVDDAKLVLEARDAGDPIDPDAVELARSVVEHGEDAEPTGFKFGFDAPKEPPPARRESAQNPRPFVTWSILDSDGVVSSGTCLVPPPDWFNKVKACVGLGLWVQGYPAIYAVRPTCSNDVDQGVSGSGVARELARFWGVQPEPGSSVWFFPDGSKIGFGRDTCEVERLVLAFQGKLNSEEVARAPDQRGQPE